jgi:hypothetical protein
VTNCVFYGISLPVNAILYTASALILYEILFGEPVFPADKFPVPIKFARQVPSYRPEIDERRCCMVLKMVMKKCLSVNPEDRPTIDDI